MEDKYIELLEQTLIDIDNIDGDCAFEDREKRKGEDWFIQMMTMRTMTQNYLNGYSS